MRTRAFLYLLFSIFALAAVLVLDLIALPYAGIRGMTFQIVRAFIEGSAMLFLIRAFQYLFFQAPSVSREADISTAEHLPMKLVRRFSVLLIGALGLTFLPNLFSLSLNKYFQPSTLGTVVSVHFIGAVWLAGLVFVGVAFGQLVFVRQDTKRARRRFSWWLGSIILLSAFMFFHRTGSLAGSVATVLEIALLGTALLAALLLGYRLPWLPYLSSRSKRLLLAMSVTNMLLGLALVYSFKNDMLAGGLLFHYAEFWYPALLSFFGTTTVYFALVFFSSLFSISSSELVERRSLEVRSLARLTRFSSDVLTSELLLDLPKLADQITALAREATESDAAWLELEAIVDGTPTTIRSYVNVNEASAQAIMESAAGFPEAERTIQSPREELYRNPKAFILRRRGRRESRFVEQNTTEDLHSLLAVPLLRRSETMGGLYVAKQREDGFDSDDLTVIAAFTDVASLAFETGKLLADSMEKQKFDGELRAARAMQRSLLPESFPPHPSYDVYALSIPAYEVGGDYYDYSVLADGSSIVLIGDVSGKGISASLYMSETKGIIQALAPLVPNVRSLVENANATLLRNVPTAGTLRRSFVTLGVLQLKRDWVHFTRTGHTPMLVIRANGRTEFHQPAGMATGLISQEIFTRILEQRSIATAPGDLFVLFSDGITDSRDQSGDELGYDRFAEIVGRHRAGRSLEAMANVILREIETFAHDGDLFFDDATLVLIRYRGERS